jgi:hypothetical protein
MKNALKLILGVVMGCSAPLLAVCDPSLAPTYTTRAGIQVPAINSCGWGAVTNGDWNIMDSSMALVTGFNNFTGSTTFTGLSWNFPNPNLTVDRIGTKLGGVNGGPNSVSIGNSSLLGFRTSGYLGRPNIAVGPSALGNFVDGGNTSQTGGLTAIGYDALGTSTGSENTAIGDFAGAYLAGGNWNQFFGYNSGVALNGSGFAYGENDTFIGQFSGPTSTSPYLSNSMAFGYASKVGQNSSLSIGCSATDCANGGYPSFKVGIGTDTPTETLHIVGNLKIQGGGTGIRFNDGTFQTTAGGGGGGGSSSLAVNQNGVQITSPTVAINALSPPFIITPVFAGTTAQWTLDPTSVTLEGPLLTQGNVWKGFNNFSGSTTFSGNMNVSSGVLILGGTGTNGQVMTSGGFGTVPSWQTPGQPSILPTTNTWTGGNTYYSSATFGAGGSMVWDNTNGVLRLGGGSSDAAGWETINEGNAISALSIRGNGQAIFVSTNTGAVMTPLVVENLNDQFSLQLETGTNARTGLLINSKPFSGPDSHFIPITLTAQDASATVNAYSIQMQSTGTTISSNTVVVGSFTVTGPGNGVITETIGVGNQAAASYTAISSSYSSVGAFLIYTSTNFTVGIGTTNAGSGTVASATPGNMAYYTGATTVSGSTNVVVTHSSITVIASSYSFTTTGAQNTIAGPGFVDIYDVNAFSTKPLLVVGSNGGGIDMLLEDRQPLFLQNFGAETGGLHLGVSGEGSQQRVQSQSRANYFEANLASTMTLNTDNDISGGDMVFQPQNTEEFRVSHLSGVKVSTSAFYMVDVSTSGHYLTGGSTPTVSSCGSGPSGSVVGNDKDGVITVGGSAPTACTLTFSQTYGLGCVVACTISDSITSTTPDVTTSPTAMTMAFSSAIGGGSVFYHCVGVTAGCQ